MSFPVIAVEFWEKILLLNVNASLKDSQFGEPCNDVSQLKAFYHKR